MKKIVTEKSFFLAFVGIILIAFSVNVIELACSAGLPILFSQILTINNLSPLVNAFYIGLYILFFLADDLLVFIIAMKTLKISAVSNKGTKYMHLVAGLIMLIIGILLIVNPGILRLANI
jgi:hypothetical protein